ncbi:DUF6671 family protein [Flavobacterium aciduliphilum]|uniref:DUF6671 domain-containing protein n=1 Tax=Flavobacterium aciduliphilum TaxID=1101402 RepID=A0A328YIH1_9FLAO|nr:DUF6671 family protein [Flavobacterium aciduliphilum]RAR70036.1 hypothetical protein CLV55_11325 [Flavobacterium aciduliphilum]
MFEGRKLLIATKHQKERVIAPIFEEALQVECFVSTKFDTDTLGTFSGEIERKDSALETLRKKCVLAMQANNCDLAIASEGSFGMHPIIMFATADDEMMIFMDSKNQIEVIVREISMDTNFDATELKTKEDLMAFVEKVNFPSHGVILKSSKEKYKALFKGINTKENLLKHFNHLISNYGSAYVETDMRAHYNPTRMKLIEIVAQKLLKTILHQCPNCQHPGFSVSRVNKGLPCELCHAPTQSTLSFTYQCKKCSFEQVDLYPHQKTKEDPTYCNFCNP